VEAVTRSGRIQAELPPEQPGSRPMLSQVQLSVLRRYGTEEAVDQGTVLFADGDDTYDLIVVLEGEVEIIEHYGHAVPLMAGLNRLHANPELARSGG